MTRRDLLKLLLGSALAEAVDVERLLWVPKPIIVVPGPLLTSLTYREVLDQHQFLYREAFEELIEVTAFGDSNRIYFVPAVRRPREEHHR